MRNPKLDNAFPIVWSDGSADTGLSKLEYGALLIYTAKLPKGQLPEALKAMLMKEAIQEAKALFEEVDDA